MKSGTSGEVCLIGLPLNCAAPLPSGATQAQSQPASGPKLDSALNFSAFTYTQLFTLSEPATAVGGVGVTLTNTIGTSTEVTSP
jgi:hypothetical protein